MWTTYSHQVRLLEVLKKKLMKPSLKTSTIGSLTRPTALRPSRKHIWGKGKSYTQKWVGNMLVPTRLPVFPNCFSFLGRFHMFLEKEAFQVGDSSSKGGPTNFMAKMLFIFWHLNLNKGDYSLSDFRTIWRSGKMLKKQKFSKNTLGLLKLRELPFIKKCGEVVPMVFGKTTRNLQDVFLPRAV